MKKIREEFMKDLSNFLSIAAVVIVFGYVIFNESYHIQAAKNFISDERVALDEIEDEATVLTNIEEIGIPIAVAYDVPEKASFANESVPLNVPDVRERFDKELQINCYLHSNTIFLIKRANRWFPQMNAIMKKYDIPDDFKYLPLIESNLLNVTSPAEAAGFWQILKTSGKEYGLEISNEVDERYDPLKSTEAACKYLRKAYQKFGNWTMAAASYNRGMGGMDRAIENQKVNSYYDLYLNDETSRYVFRLLALKEIIEHPSKYGFKIKSNLLYKQEPLHYVKVSETIKDLVSFANMQGVNYKLLKRHNPWLRDEKLTVKKGKNYNIAIPEIQN
jgi:membrane-bound lytic murein transglycosylase D